MPSHRLLVVKTDESESFRSTGFTIVDDLNSQILRLHRDSNGSRNGFEKTSKIVTFSFWAHFDPLMPFKILKFVLDLVKWLNLGLEKKNNE